jgi:predicted nucleic acid-binding protein
MELMTFYADTSFLVRILIKDSDSEEANNTHRSLGRPLLYYTEIHSLEVTNALRMRTFIGSHTAPAAMKKLLLKEEEIGFRRLRQLLDTGRLISIGTPWLEVLKTAIGLSDNYCRRVGVRSLDIIHVANCLTLNCRNFITCDLRQAALAKAAGLKVSMPTIK